MPQQFAGQSHTGSTVFIVDPDADGRRSVRNACLAVNLVVESFAAPEDLLASLTAESAGCVVAEMRLPRQSGLALQEYLLHEYPALPIVFVIAEADPAIIAQAMRQGAVDFIEKPVRPYWLLEAVNQALDLYQMRRKHLHRQLQIRNRLAALSTREREVLTSVFEGLSNKQIATQLHLSVRTVEHHRQSMMKKMIANNLIELVNMIYRLRLPLPRTLLGAAEILPDPQTIALAAAEVTVD